MNHLGSVWFILLGVGFLACVSTLRGDETSPRDGGGRPNGASHIEIPQRPGDTDTARLFRQRLDSLRRRGSLNELKKEWLDELLRDPDRIRKVAEKAQRGSDDMELMNWAERLAQDPRFRDRLEKLMDQFRDPASTSLPTPQDARDIERFQRLAEAYQLDKQKDLAQKVLKDPEKLNALAKKFENDPGFRRLVESLQSDPQKLEQLRKMSESFTDLRRPPDLDPQDLETIKRLAEAVQGSPPPQTGVSETKPSGTTRPRPNEGKGIPSNESGTADKPARSGSSEASQEAGRRLARWAERNLSDLKGPLEKSKALERAARNLSQFDLTPNRNRTPLDPTSTQGIEERLARLKDRVTKTGSWLEKTLPDQPRSPREERPRQSGSLPNVKLPDWKLSGGSPPRPPSMPRVGPQDVSAGSFAQGLLWVVLIGCVGLILWRLLSWRLGTADGQRRTGWRLGPWPVDPTEVRTRGELVQAFEYLSLLQLGRDAAARNHREIETELGGSRLPGREAAANLATLYEKARYAPPEDDLTSEALATARRDLCLLAGVRSA